MTRQVIFEDILRLLNRYGFRQASVKGNHMLYEHKPSGVLLAFRPHAESEKVDSMTLLMVQTTLDQTGFVEREDFERELLQTSTQPRKRK
jgi:predicted RNA binding protein YcfA (HicA-like mRNA interferase family)